MTSPAAYRILEYLLPEASVANDGGETIEGKKRSIQLVILGGSSAEPFELIDGSLL